MHWNGVKWYKVKCVNFIIVKFLQGSFTSLFLVCFFMHFYHLFLLFYILKPQGVYATFCSLIRSYYLVLHSYFLTHFYSSFVLYSWASSSKNRKKKCHISDVIRRLMLRHLAVANSVVLFRLNHKPRSHEHINFDEHEHRSIFQLVELSNT